MKDGERHIADVLGASGLGWIADCEERDVIQRPAEGVAGRACFERDDDLRPSSATKNVKSEQHEPGATDDRQEQGKRRPGALKAEWALVLATMVLAIAGIIQARASVAAANAAIEAVRSGEQQFVRSERPYVLVPEAPHIAEAGGRFVVDVYTGNYGRSPALHSILGVKIILDASDFQIEQSFHYLDSLDLPGAVKVADGSIEIIPPGVAHGSFTRAYSDPRKPEERSNLLKANRALAVVGRDSYIDMRGNHYKTDFCFVQVNGALAYCERHNDLD